MLFIRLLQWKHLRRKFGSERPRPCPLRARHCKRSVSLLKSLTRTCLRLRDCSYGDESRIHALTAEAMVALATRRPRDPRTFLTRCFSQGRVPEEDEEEQRSPSSSLLDGWDDARPPFLVYFEPALVRAACQQIPFVVCS